MTVSLFSYPDIVSPKGDHTCVAMLFTDDETKKQHIFGHISYTTWLSTGNYGNLYMVQFSSVTINKDMAERSEEVADRFVEHLTNEAPEGYSIQLVKTIKTLDMSRVKFCQVLNKKIVDMFPIIKKQKG